MFQLLVIAVLILVAMRIYQAGRRMHLSPTQLRSLARLSDHIGDLVGNGLRVVFLVAFAIIGYAALTTLSPESWAQLALFWAGLTLAVTGLLVVLESTIKHIKTRGTNRDAS